MDYLYGFVIGGTICTIGQILIDATKLTPPKILVIFVVSGAVLTGLGLYEPLVEIGGNGATVPLPGFGYALTKGAIEGAAESGWLGALNGALKNTAAGLTAAVVFGYLVALVFSPKSKR